MDLHIPSGWRVVGALPEISGDEISERDLDLLEEDLVQITDPDGAFTLDVGWYPASQANGEFVCRMVESNDWDMPLEEYSTRRLVDVAEWIHIAVSNVVDRLGEPTELTPVKTRKIAGVVLTALLGPSLANNSTSTAGDVSVPKPQLPQANVSHAAKSFALTK